MIIIRCSADMARAMRSPLAGNLKDLLSLRRDQLAEHLDHDLSELAQFIIAVPGDTLAEIEAAATYPVLPDPPWEWVLNHDGVFEAPIIVSDDGFGIVLIVPDCEGVDPTLRTLLRRDANAHS